MIFLAASFGAVIGIVGTFVSASFDRFPAGPVIILTGSLVLAFSMLGAPRRGLVARFVSERRFRKEIESRALLQEIYEYAEEGAWPTKKAVLHRPGERAALGRLIHEGLVRIADGDRLQLTFAGKNRAEKVVQGSRLWRAFLDTYPDLAGSIVDLSHESVDALLPAETVNELTDLVRSQGRWPTLTLAT
jgi:manganese/zinc/iron transport system permease protein